MDKRYIFYLYETDLSFIKHVNFGKFDIQRVIDLYKKYKELLTSTKNKWYHP